MRLRAHRHHPAERAPAAQVRRAAPGTPPIMVRRNSFPLVKGVHSNPLRSRERRFESCWGRHHDPAKLFLTCANALTLGRPVGANIRPGRDRAFGP